MAVARRVVSGRRRAGFAVRDTPIHLPGGTASPVTRSVRKSSGSSSLVSRQRAPCLKREAIGIALFGHSRGGGAVLNYVLHRRGIRAAVLEFCAVSFRPFCTFATSCKHQLLMLHGTDDRLGRRRNGVHERRDGARIRARLAARLQSRLRPSIMPGGRHNDIFAQQSRLCRSSCRRITAFLDAAPCALQIVRCLPATRWNRNVSRVAPPRSRRRRSSSWSSSPRTRAFLRRRRPATPPSARAA